MELYEITEELKVSPGEYVMHMPSESLVLCGTFKRSHNKIRALGGEGVFEDEIENFRKIKLDQAEKKAYKDSRCKKCGKK
tara:strand:- start:695 stop:934 length:240 start_codon:yes stop_codon:yes gene_type:complete